VVDDLPASGDSAALQNRDPLVRAGREVAPLDGRAALDGADGPDQF
jgi:hypothetical protein